MPELLQAIKAEMALRSRYIGLPDTLYIGGGTPSLCEATALGGLIGAAKALWQTDFEEVTVELNPEDITLAYCQRLADYGVNRLSIGVQSFFDEHLRFMNRRHNGAQAIKAVEAARWAGFTNVGIDLIFGFPGLTRAQWRQNIMQALSLSPEHISAYQLGIEPGTPFFKRYKEGLLRPVAQEEAAAQYALLQQRLSAAGWEQYEVSNFAKKGYRSKHNSAYWRGVPYLGLGPSAHSFNGVARHANVSHLGRYLKGISALQLPLKEERLTPKKRYNEFVMTRLRTAEGLSLAALEQQGFHANIRRHFKEAVFRLLQQGLLTEQEGFIKIPSQKWFVLDGIIIAMLV